MLLSGLLKTTLLDYPEHVAATVFLGGCNMCCPFCHNSSLVVSPESAYTLEELMHFLKKRATILDGVCITGGEPTIYPELLEFLKPIKDLGYSIKLDTNGTNPHIIASLVSKKLIDYVAMDVKLPFDEYETYLGYHGSKEILLESLHLLLSGIIPYELRTTVVKELHTPQRIQAMGEELKGADRLYLQNFIDSGSVIKPNLHSVSEDTLREYQDILKAYIPNTYIRGEQSSSGSSTSRT